jgi:glycosyl transferase family 11
MLTVRVGGGLGNQLFQYALGRALQGRGQQVQYDISGLIIGDDRRYTLGDLGLELPLCASQTGTFREEGTLRFMPDILEMTGDWTLNGYWQTEKYFLDVQDKIRGEVFSGMEISPKTDEIGQAIRAHKNSCFVHVRRTDNLTARAAPTHTLLTREGCDYYEQAIRTMRENIPGVQFFAFSDDPQWLHQMWGSCKHFVIVDHNPMSGELQPDFEVRGKKRGRECEDLWLMSLCSHAIIANSTFSWHGAWLNRHEAESPRRRIVIAPNLWFATKELDSTDIVPERWIKL